MGPTFSLDEAPLRQWILKAYHEHRKATGASKRILDAVRQFLSGAPGGESVVARYWFEEDPVASTKSFVEDLERAAQGLSRLALDPLLAAMEEMQKRGDPSLAPSIPVFISSLAGPVALKIKVDETLASAAISAAIIGLSRAGRDPFDAALATVKA